MSRTIELIIYGDPKAQKRHRSTSRGGFTRQYDPSASDKADFLSVVQKNAPTTPFDSPLHLELNFYFSRPKSHYNKKGLKQDAPIWHTSKPDNDNLYKLVGDALNKVFWRDDSVIVSTSITKRYDEKPRTEIKITQI